MSRRPGYHQSFRRQVNLLRAPWDAYIVIAGFDSGGASAHMLDFHANTHPQTNVV